MAQRLLDATDQLLQRSGPQELTEREIAAAAGVDEGMIRYYFNGRDGLLYALLEQHSERVSAALAKLPRLAGDPATLTYRLITRITAIYEEKPWIMRIMAAETIRPDSDIRRRFIDRFGPDGLGLQPLQQLIGRLQSEGHFNAGIDARRTAQSIIWEISAPLLLASMYTPDGGQPGTLSDPERVRHVAALFDAHLRHPADADSGTPQPRRRRRPAD